MSIRDVHFFHFAIDNFGSLIFWKGLSLWIRIGSQTKKNIPSSLTDNDFFAETKYDLSATEAVRFFLLDLWDVWHVLCTNFLIKNAVPPYTY